MYGRNRVDVRIKYTFNEFKLVDQRKEKNQTDTNCIIPNKSGTGWDRLSYTLSFITQLLYNIRNKY